MAITFQSRNTCELCGAQNPESLLSKPFTDPAVWSFLTTYYEGRATADKTLFENQKYEIMRCGSCGFMWQKYILNDDGMAALYSRWIESSESFKKKNEADVTLYAGYAREAENIVRLFRRSPSSIRVLDFGMGWGYWCLMARAFGYQVTGLEISPERVVQARAKGLDAVETMGELAGRQFDFINAEQVFEHVPHPFESLAQLMPHVADGGIIRIAVPSSRRARAKLSRPSWKASKDEFHPLEHINTFTRKTLIDLGKRAGLAVHYRQPFQRVRGFGLISFVKTFLLNWYRRFFGTTIYFKKIAKASDIISANSKPV